MKKSAGKQQPIRQSNLKRFLPYYRPYAKIAAFDLFCALFTTVCEMIFPLIVRYITNLAADDISGLSVSVILIAGGIYLGLRVIDVAANYFMQSVGHIMGAKMETDMRRDLYNHINRLSFLYFDDTKTGQLISRLTSDLFDITELAHHGPEELFIAAVKLVFAFVILSFFNIYLTLIIFAFIPLMVFFALKLSRRMNREFKRRRNQAGEMSAAIEDSLLGVKVVKSYNGEEAEAKKFEKENGIYLGMSRGVYRAMATFHNSNRIFDGLMYLTVIVVGGVFLLYRWIDPGDFAAYILYVSTLLTTVRRIVDYAEQFQRGSTAIARFYEVMDQTPENYEGEELRNVKGEVCFKNVSFKYGEGREILSGINLTVPAGKTIAIAGPSGSGKTTLCSLIPRFYELSAGEITIDGRNVKEYSLQSLRQAIGIVQQDVYIFAGSIRENIAYGKPNASDAEIKEAALLAGADEFICDMENGYDTYVGERGVKLSGGQKQRLSIARAFLKNPPILILDEATSSLDLKSEKIVKESLDRLAKGRTTLVIAHRLSTVKNADEIVVLTEEGIAERGKHEELLKRGGLYSELYRMM